MEMMGSSKMGFDFYQMSYVAENRTLHRLVSENRSFEKMFAYKREEVVELSKLHNEELHSLIWFSPSIMWVINQR
jgi:hypothetical protein